MQKKEKMYIVEMEEKPLDNMLQAFYKGADVVFVTEAKKFWGG